MNALKEIMRQNKVKADNNYWTKVATILNKKGPPKNPKDWKNVNLSKQ